MKRTQHDLSSSMPPAALEGASRPLRLGCLMLDAAHAAELHAWARDHASFVTLEHDAPRLESHDVCIADAAHAPSIAERFATLGNDERPEVVLVGLSALAALRIKERFPLAIEVRERWCLPSVVAAIQQIAAVRRPLRALCRDIVGAMDMPDALALLRYHMLSAALARTGTKRAAAKLLGVTRPAVQQMAKGYALPSELPSGAPGSQTSELQTS